MCMLCACYIRAMSVCVCVCVLLRSLSQNLWISSVEVLPCSCWWFGWWSDGWKIATFTFPRTFSPWWKVRENGKRFSFSKFYVLQIFSQDQPDYQISMTIPLVHPGSSWFMALWRGDLISGIGVVWPVLMVASKARLIVTGQFSNWRRLLVIRFCPRHRIDVKIRIHKSEK